MKNKYDGQKATTTTEVQTPDLGQIHIEFGRINK